MHKRCRHLTHHAFPRPEDLVGTNSVTENNVMQYLAAIENKALSILSAAHGDGDLESCTSTDVAGDEKNNHSTSLFTVGTLGLPSAELDGDDDDDEGDRPFSMKELQKSLQAMG